MPEIWKGSWSTERIKKKFVHKWKQNTSKLNRLHEKETKISLSDCLEVVFPIPKKILKHREFAECISSICTSFSAWLLLCVRIRVWKIPENKVGGLKSFQTSFFVCLSPKSKNSHTRRAHVRRHSRLCLSFARKASSYSALIVDTDWKCYLPGQTAGYCEAVSNDKHIWNNKDETKTKMRGDE